QEDLVPAVQPHAGGTDDVLQGALAEHGAIVFGYGKRRKVSTGRAETRMKQKRGTGNREQGTGGRGGVGDGRRSFPWMPVAVIRAHARRRHPRVRGDPWDVAGFPLARE